MDVELFTNTLNLLEELECKTFVHFSNKIMSTIYTLIFDQELPSVTEMMRSNLQTGSKVTEDWFLYVEYTEIRLYGFTWYPFLLLAFLTDKIFSLEFSRKRIHTEEEHFLNIKKG